MVGLMVRRMGSGKEGRWWPVVQSISCLCLCLCLCVFVFVFVFLLREWEVGRRQVVAGGSINTLPRMAHFSPSMPSPNTATLVNTKEQPCNCLGATSDAVKRAHQLAYQLVLKKITQLPHPYQIINKDISTIQSCISKILTPQQKLKKKHKT